VSAVQCLTLTVERGRTEVLRGIDLEVSPGEVVGLLGVSGSGKSTLLSTIAGFLRPKAGEVWLQGRMVSSPRRTVAPERRALGVVFQGTALWPHMTAGETVAYPLRRQGVDRARARAEALDLLDKLGIGPLSERRPAELSGGEQQRVAVARAFARGAAVHLLDEPTAHLDAAHRRRLLDVLAEIRAASGAAVLHATHDVEEAMSMADRLAVLRAGRIVQAGPPAEVYARPADGEVARLTGPASVLIAEAKAVAHGCAEVTIGSRRVPVAVGGAFTGSRGHLLVRPEWAQLGGQLPGTVRRAWYRGAHTDYRLATEGGEVEVRQPGPPVARVGENVTWRLDRAWPLPDGAD